MRYNDFTVFQPYNVRIGVARSSDFHFKPGTFLYVEIPPVFPQTLVSPDVPQLKKGCDSE